MLRQTLFCEVEVVRYEDGEQTAPSRRLEFSVRPLHYVIGSLVTAGLAAALVLGLIWPAPENAYAGNLSAYCTWGNPDPYYRYYEPTHCCGCGTLDPIVGTGADVVTPLRTGNDSTLLVRRLP